MHQEVACLGWLCVPVLLQIPQILILLRVHQHSNLSPRKKKKSTHKQSETNTTTSHQEIKHGTSSKELVLVQQYHCKSFHNIENFKTKVLDF
jgi:hypothetical protein